MLEVEAMAALSLEGILAVLELVAEGSTRPTATGLAAALGMRRGELSRLLAALVGRGLISRNSRGVYTIAPVAEGLAQYLVSQRSVISHARPFLEELATKHGESVSLSVLRNDQLIVLDVAEVRRQESSPSLVGRCSPSLATTAGKAIRAFQSRDLLEKWVRERAKWVRKLDLERLFAELDAIRSAGVAVDVGSLEEGIGSVAATVRDYAGKVVCALTVLGPSIRMFTERIEAEIVPSLVAGAELLSTKFGCAKWSRS
jgi:DNA-binding IclR family transcriptional regulator